MRLQPLPPDQLDAEQRRFHADSVAFAENSFKGFIYQREDGALLGPWSVWIRHPAVGEASQALGTIGALPPRIHEIVILTFGAH